MGLKDLFGKKNKQTDDAATGDSEEKKAKIGSDAISGAAKFSGIDPTKGMDINSMLDMVDTSKMTTMQKMGLKMFKKLPQGKQEQILRQAFNPKEIYKNKDKMKAQIDEMVKAGMIDKSQAEAVKSKMGIR